ncbi:MAG: ComEC family competence protein, partial [Candidatus Omnitrophica bacterium]|nr:ComEC family competence protein [Candidatus Omnitrophota bacterium]
MKRPLLGIALAFSLGILAQESLNIPFFNVLALALILILSAFLFIRSEKSFLALSLTAFFSLGALAHIHSIQLPGNHVKNIFEENHDFPVRALVKGRVWNRPVARQIYFGQEKTEFLLDVKTIGIDKVYRRVSGLILTGVLNPGLDLRYGDDLIIEGNLLRVRPATNPGQFDYKKYLERRKIFYVFKANNKDFVKVTGRGGVNFIKEAAYRAAEKIEALIDAFLPPLEASMLEALLLGERRDIPDEVNDSFINTGTVHILSISGLHVGLLAVILIILFKLFRAPSAARPFILTALLAFYCVMVDNMPPVVRSTIMISVFLFGGLLK